MRTVLVRTASAAAILYLAAGCGSGTHPVGGEPDAQTKADAAIEDGAAPSDSTVPSDSSPPTDSGAPSDSTLPSDGPISDAPSSDAPGALGNTCRPFAMPSTTALFGSTKKVFAHYFSFFSLSYGDDPADADYYNTQFLTPTGENDKWLSHGGYLRQRPLPVPVSDAGDYKLVNMEREVKMAIAGGITGFTIDMLGPIQATDGGTTQAGTDLQNLLQAAAAVDPRFKIVVMPDMSGLASAGATVEATEVEAMIASVASSPAAYKLADGRLVVSAFYAELQPASWWQSVLSNLTGMGIRVAFVPVFLNLGANEAAFAPISYGLSVWGTATPAAALGLQGAPAGAHDAGDIFMSPILSQQYRPKDFIFWEAGNSLSLRNAWTSAIAGNADWIQVVTWSDFSESGEIEPYTDSTLSGGIGTGYYDVNAYYASWFLTGQAPAITNDVLYYFYRREPTDAAAPAQDAATTAQGGAAAENDIELLAFLTAPGTLTITVNGQTVTQSAPAGVTSMKTPLEPGTPQFGLTRGGSTVISLQGGVQSYGPAGLPSGILDLTYWTGSGSSAGACTLSVP